MNKLLLQNDVAWTAYGASSVIHICMGTHQAQFDPLAMSRTQLHNSQPELVRQLRLAMLLNGVDLSPTPGALLSASHTSNDVEDTLRAFSQSLQLLKQARLL